MRRLLRRDLTEERLYAGHRLCGWPLIMISRSGGGLHPPCAWRSLSRLRQLAFTTLVSIYIRNEEWRKRPAYSDIGGIPRPGIFGYFAARARSESIISDCELAVVSWPSFSSGVFFFVFGVFGCVADQLTLGARLRSAVRERSGYARFRSVSIPGLYLEHSRRCRWAVFSGVADGAACEVIIRRRFIASRHRSIFCCG